MKCVKKKRKIDGGIEIHPLLGISIIAVLFLGFFFVFVQPCQGTINSAEIIAISQPNLQNEYRFTAELENGKIRNIYGGGLWLKKIDIGTKVCVREKTCFLDIVKIYNLNGMYDEKQGCN